MQHEMKLRAIYFDKIVLGEKVFEVRLNDEKRKAIAIGDTIIFKKLPELEKEIETVVTDLIHFKSFTEMAKNLSSTEIGFEDCSEKSIVDAYHEFYSVEDENKFGVLAIKVKCLK